MKSGVSAPDVGRTIFALRPGSGTNLTYCFRRMTADLHLESNAMFRRNDMFATVGDVPTGAQLASVTERACRDPA